MKRFSDMSHRAVFEVWLIFKWYPPSADIKWSLEEWPSASFFTSYRNENKKCVIGRSFPRASRAMCRHICTRVSRRRLNDVSSRAVKLCTFISTRTAMQWAVILRFPALHTHTHEAKAVERIYILKSTHPESTMRHLEPSSPSFFFFGLVGM